MSGCVLTNRIACGSPDGEIGLNTDDFRFLVKYGQEIGPIRALIGDGDRTVDLRFTLAHEVGHWFGLQHEKDPEGERVRNIMSPGYRPRADWCVKPWNLRQLDNAVDRSWDYRLLLNSGLRFED